MTLVDPRPTALPGCDAPTVDDARGLLARSIDITGGPARDLLELDDTVAALLASGLPHGSTVVLAVGTGRNLLTLHLACVVGGFAPVAVAATTRSQRLTELATSVGAAAVIAAHPQLDALGAVSLGTVGPYLLARLAGPDVLRPGTVLIPTSGTSGVSSACVHRVGSLARNARRHAAAVGLGPEDTVLVSLPLFYSFALVAQAYAAMQVGARLVLTGPPFTPAAFADAASANAVTSCSLTPTAVRMMLARGVTLPPRVRMLTIGGDSLSIEHAEAVRTSHPQAAVFTTYGLTEAGPRVSTLALHDHPRSRLDSVGLPLEGTFVHLRDRDPDGIGELLVESDTLLVDKLGGTPGSRTTVAPGVLATGDRFRIDADGYLRFAGRLGDIVVVRGEKVSLNSVRTIVNAVPGVLGCTTTADCDDDGETCYDLEVIATEPDRAAVSARVRTALGIRCLGAERPRSVAVVAAGPSFRK